MRRTLSSLPTAGALGLLLLSGWPGAAAAQGTEFNLSCRDGEVLVGIRGVQGWWMDGIGPRCRSVRPSGELARSVRDAGYGGGYEGTLQTFDCRPDEVMVGYTGSQGANGYVLYLHEVICAPWQPDTRTAGTPTRTLPAFEKNDAPGHLIADSCAQGTVGTRLRGRAGMYLDRLADIGCSYFTQAIPPVLPASD
jgi:hypothetical protein